ncbi:hypothetical protein ACLOJK_008646 [Asimina triloba]
MRKEFHGLQNFKDVCKRRQARERDKVRINRRESPLKTLFLSQKKKNSSKPLFQPQPPQRISNAAAPLRDAKIPRQSQSHVFSRHGMELPASISSSPSSASSSSSAAAAAAASAALVTLANSIQALGRGFDVTSDIRLLYCKGAPGSRLIQIDEEHTREIAVGDGLVLRSVSVDFECVAEKKCVRESTPVWSFHEVAVRRSC